jgi:hypothetical protein
LYGKCGVDRQGRDFVPNLLEASIFGVCRENRNTQASPAGKEWVKKSLVKRRPARFLKPGRSVEVGENNDLLAKS